MIQFNRYRHADEPADFHQDIGRLVDLMMQGIRSCPEAGIPLLFEMGEKYVGNIRLAAIAARLHFWGILGWKDIEAMVPQELPKNWWFAQEIAGCLGFERVNRLWHIEEDDWNVLQGQADDHVEVGSNVRHGYISYQPPNSGFFSVIENIVAAQIVAEQDGYGLKVDLSGNWWAYDEPFEDIFEDIFEFCSGGLPIMRFSLMRDRFFKADINQARVFSNAKRSWYTDISWAISGYAGGSTEDDVGTMFIRGGDKIKTETILPPMHIVMREMDWMKRHCRRRVLLSDDPVIADWIAARDPEIVNRANRLQGGYHHLPQRKQSCIPILQNYLAMVEAKHNFSCPSANLVNAAQWSREDHDNYSLTNPVHRYLLI